ncbi:MAG: M12 family metallo-peptidase [Planctomycetota bacterium]|nr:M12 family metallo-peptidase [Planctomycetota bacterium]
MTWPEKTFRPNVARASLLVALAAASAMGAVRAPIAAAGTVIVANRSRQTVRFAVADTEGNWRKLVLKPEQLVPIPVVGKAECQLTLPSGPRRYELLADSLYLARADEDQPPYLQRIVFGGDSARQGPAAATHGADWKGTQPGTIRVKIFVDEEDQRRDSRWQEKMKKRMAAASQVLEYYCRMRVTIEGFDRWVSDNQLQDFNQAMVDFEKTAQKGAADLAIGFTSQFPVTRKMAHVGGTLGPLRSHILIREYGVRVSEMERLEILLHELGHFLGAAHSPERSSLMRTVLGDGQANRRTFRVAYDAYNVLAMNIVAEQWRRRQSRNFRQLDSTALQRLAAIYGEIARFYTADQAALNLLSLVTRSPEHGALAVRRAVLQVAWANQNRTAADQLPYKDDVLMALYVRTAAAVADKLPKEYARQAFLLGLGLSLDQHNVLSRFAPVARKIALAESPQERRERLRVIGKPTVHGRVDLAQHFLASAVLTLAVGSGGAEAAGLYKEISDTQGGTGFSFADVAADLAGVELATALLKDKVSLKQLRKDFHVSRYVLDVTSLEEGLSLDQLTSRYGAITSPQFQTHLESLRRQIRLLPGYQATANGNPAAQEPADKPQ